MGGKGEPECAPATAARPDVKVYVGVFRDFKWAGKYYEGEILGISGERKAV